MNNKKCFEWDYRSLRGAGVKYVINMLQKKMLRQVFGWT